MILVVALGFGFRDGRGRFAVARRQYVQAAMVALLSIPLYGTPVLLYLAGYLIGRRLPASDEPVSTKPPIDDRHLVNHVEEQKN